MFQTTISSPITLQGISGHNGKPTSLTCYPGVEGSGIVFVRTDLDHQELKLAWDVLREGSYCTILDNGRFQLQTTEHFLSAVCALGIDNLRIEIDNDELPAMDGSAAPFFFALKAAGLKQQNKPKQMLKVLKTVRINREDGAWAELSPASEGLSVAYQLQYDDAREGLNGNFALEVNAHNFAHQVARARTFGFQTELETVQAMGKAKGFTPDNGMLFSDNGQLQGVYRLENECVRHKALDAIGDLFCIGMPMVSDFSGYKSGHALNAQLIQKLMADSSNFEIITPQAGFQAA